MTFEKKCVVKEDLTDRLLRRDETATFRFAADALEPSAHHRLYFTCEDRMHYALKDEPQTDKLYMLIDDSLDTEHARTRRYCLDLSCKSARPIPKRALAKINWGRTIDGHATYGVSKTEFSMEIFAMAKDLTFAEGGYARMRFERWAKKPGVDPRLTKNAPDDTFFLNFPEGTYDYQRLKLPVSIPEDTACIIITVEAELCSGELYVEDPSLISGNGRNVCPDFDLCIPVLDKFSWFGQNLSKKEWPEFLITLNGETIFEGEAFLRIHRYASVELPIPDGIEWKEENELTITYTSHYHDTVPLAIREIMILERPSAPFSISVAPRAAAIEKDMCVLLRTEKENVTLSVVGDDFEAVSALSFAEPGLYTARFRVKKRENHLTLALTDGETTDSVEIPYIVTRGEDGVHCGSSDLIYIDNSDKTAVEDFIEWFFDKEMGDLLTIRPAYRWGGHRTLEPELWKKFNELCNGMDAVYAHMLDGRDMPAMYCNPHPDMLAGKGFLGRQLHERDGQFFYWGYPTRETYATTELFYDLGQRLSREHPLTTEITYGVDNVAVQEGVMSLEHNVKCDRDMREAYECTIRDLKRLRKGNTRHTGPTIMFKYFHDAGFQFAAAETMYQPMEPCLAFLRGSEEAYGNPSLGVHHAVQWGTTPHDTEPRYRRFMLANYVSYMQGVHEINTEEGFWHLENGFYNHHRFSEATARHREGERRIVRFAQSHTRSGHYYAPGAFLHGRYDGWNGFGNKKVMGMPQMLVGEPEESWALMKYFYPLANISKAGLRPGPRKTEADDQPRGYYTGTPNGNVDVVPIERADFSRYQYLVFAGYNAAEAGDFDRLLEYVKKGGTLLCGWPHLSYTTNRDAIEGYRHQYLHHPLVDCLTLGHPIFEAHTWNGKSLEIAVNVIPGAEVLIKTDDGLPLVYAVKQGDGEILLINSRLYPANEAIRPAYDEMIVMLHDRVEATEPNGMECGTDVQYTVYAQEDGTRHYYVTPVDWYNQPDFKRHATLRVGTDRYELALDFGTIVKLFVTDTAAAWTEEDTAEVLSVTDSEVTLQGLDTVTLHVAHGGKETVVTVDCSKNPIQTVAL